MNIKKCNKCGVVYEATNKNFAKSKNCKQGLRTICKTCDKAYRKKHYEDNKSNIRKKQNEYLKKYHEENKEIISEYKKEYYSENKEAIAERVKNYREENLTNIKKYAQQYRKNNKTLFSKYKQDRRSKIERLNSTLTVSQWISIKKKFNNKCAYCGINESEHLKKWNEKLHQEHFVALKNKGEYTSKNIIPACKSCNGSKRDRDFFEWYPKQDYYNQNRQEFILKHLGYKKLYF